jgi:hypothetical protein
MGVRAIILVLALVAGLSWPAAPRANAFTLLEWSVVLSLIKNQLNVVCFAESPNGDNVQAAIDGIRQGLATYAPEVTLVLGTAAADTLIGTDGPDLIFGFGGNDVISGLGGNDFICGGPGDDVLIGGPGDDTLIGDPGNDQIFPDERPLPQREEDCKNDGWQQYGMFKTQGDCVSYVATGGRNPGAL